MFRGLCHSMCAEMQGQIGGVSTLFLTLYALEALNSGDPDYEDSAFIHRAMSLAHVPQFYYLVLFPLDVSIFL